MKALKFDRISSTDVPDEIHVMWNFVNVAEIDEAYLLSTNEKFQACPCHVNNVDRHDDGGWTLSQWMPAPESREACKLHGWVYDMYERYVEDRLAEMRTKLKAPPVISLPIVATVMK